jgi:hypothetical protein
MPVLILRQTNNGQQLPLNTHSDQNLADNNQHDKEFGLNDRCQGHIDLEPRRGTWKHQKP